MQINSTLPSLKYNTCCSFCYCNIHYYTLAQVFSSLKWGKQKKTLLLSTYKAVTRPILIYVSAIWSPISSTTNIMNNTKHSTAHCNWMDIHDLRNNDTTTTHTHIKNQEKISSDTSTPFSYKAYHCCPKQEKQNVFTTTKTLHTSNHTKNVTFAYIKQNMKRIHTTTVTTYLGTRKINKLI